MVDSGGHTAERLHIFYRAQAYLGSDVGLDVGDCVFSRGSEICGGGQVSRNARIKLKIIHSAGADWKIVLFDWALNNGFNYGFYLIVY